MAEIDKEALHIIDTAKAVGAAVRADAMAVDEFSGRVMFSFDDAANRDRAVGLGLVKKASDAEMKEFYEGGGEHAMTRYYERRQQNDPVHHGRPTHRWVWRDGGKFCTVHRAPCE